MAAQTSATGTFVASIWVFGLAAATFMVMLTSGALILAHTSDARRHDLRSVAPAVKRWGGAVLLLIGGWLMFLAIANPTELLP